MPYAAYNRKLIRARIEYPNIAFCNFYFALPIGKPSRGGNRANSSSDIAPDAGASTRASSHVSLRSASTVVATPASCSHQFAWYTSSFGKVSSFFIAKYTYS